MEHEHEAVPSIKRKTIPIPGRPGSWNFGSEIGERHFNIPLKVTDHDRIELQRKQNAFVAFLFDEFGKPRPIKMTFDYEPDKYYTVEISSFVSPGNAIHFFRTMGLPLVASDPMKYASANEYDPKENYLYDRDYMYDIGLMYDNPKSFEWVYEKHYSGINNYSTLVADFVIEIQGTVTNPSVTNLNDGTKLTLPGISNGRLLINGNTYSVTRNGQDVLGGSNYNFFHIQPGEVGFLFEGEKPSATVTYKWVHKFM